MSPSCHRKYFWPYILLGSLATRLRCGGIFLDHFIADFLLNVPVKMFLGGIAEIISYSAYCDYVTARGRSVRLYVCLSHSCTLLKSLDGMRCHLARILVSSPITFYYRQGPPSPTGRGDLGVVSIARSDAAYIQGGPKKRGHSVLQKYCSDLHDFFAEIKVV